MAESLCLEWCEITHKHETPEPISIKRCMVAGFLDIITYTSFGDHRLRAYFLGRGSNLPLLYRVLSPHLQHSRTTLRVCDM